MQTVGGHVFTVYILFIDCYRIQKLPRLLVATAEGQFFIYNVDPLDGGECMLVYKHRFVKYDYLIVIIRGKIKKKGTKKHNIPWQ